MGRPPCPWRGAGSRAARLAVLVAATVLLAGCSIIDKNPLAGIDRPSPSLGSAGDLDASALRRIAEQAEANGVDATEVWRRLADRDPSAPEPRLALAGRAYRQGHLAEAEAAYRGVLAIDSRNLRALTGLGAVYDNGGRRAEAQAQYRRALAIDPRDKVARHNLGLSLALGGQFEEGVPILESLAAEPDATEAHRATLKRALALRDGGTRRGRRAASAPTQ